MKWLIKKLLALLGLYSAPVPVSMVGKVNPLEAPWKTTIIRAREVPFRSGNFFYSHDGLNIAEGVRDELGVEEQEVVLATPPRRYGALPLSKIPPGTSIPLSRHEDIAALLTAQPSVARGPGFLHTGETVSVFHTKGKGGEVCEGFIFHFWEKKSLPIWCVDVRMPGHGPWDPKNTWVIYPIEEP